MFDKTCRTLVANYSVFNEVVISKSSHYVRHVNEVVTVRYLLLPVTSRVSCGDNDTECSLTRKGLTLKWRTKNVPLWQPLCCLYVLVLPRQGFPLPLPENSLRQLGERLQEGVYFLLTESVRADSWTQTEENCPMLRFAQELVYILKVT
jgi:hypothetical protein